MTPLTSTPATGTVDHVVEAIRAELDKRGIPLFDSIDHATNARHAHMHLPGESVILFGNPTVGTQLMQADPEVGIELPLRLLVWDDNGTTRIGYRDPRELATTYRLDEVTGVLDSMATLLEALVSDVT
jgi:uncharacterized protein (DUF302 family)